MSARRRRGLLLLCAALASGGLAASEVSERQQRAAERLGPSVEVLVAARDLRARARIGRDAIAARSVPARFAPPDALPSATGVIGARLARSVPAGAYLTASVFDAERTDERGLRAGERAVTIEVAGGGADAALQPGARVDVLVSTETGAVGGRTTMPLVRVSCCGLSREPRVTAAAMRRGPQAGSRPARPPSPRSASASSRRSTSRQPTTSPARSACCRGRRATTRAPATRSRRISSDEPRSARRCRRRSP